MNLSKVLVPDAVRMEIRGRTKPEIVGELLDLLVAAGRVRARERALAALLAREQKMSTGLQDGLALPHATVDAVEGLVAAVGLVREGVDFDSLDGRPSRFFVLTLSPPNRAVAHIQFLAKLSRVLGAPGALDQLLAAQSAAEVMSLLGRPGDGKEPE